MPEVCCSVVMVDRCVQSYSYHVLKMQNCFLPLKSSPPFPSPFSASPASTLPQATTYVLFDTIVSPFYNFI